MRTAALASIFLAACGSTDDAPPPPVAHEVIGRTHSSDVLEGNLVRGGQRLALLGCKPGHTERVFVEVVTSGGKLRFQAMQLYWNSNPGGDRGTELACSKLDRSWGGGIRRDGTAYWRGTLDFACEGLGGTLKLDCGEITREERASLDANRGEMREHQKSR